MRSSPSAWMSCVISVTSHPYRVNTRHSHGIDTSVLPSASARSASHRITHDPSVSISAHPHASAPTAHRHHTQPSSVISLLRVAAVVCRATTCSNAPSTAPHTSLFLSFRLSRLCPRIRLSRLLVHRSLPLLPPLLPALRCVSCHPRLLATSVLVMSPSTATRSPATTHATTTLLSRLPCKRISTHPH
jgi:hypothetical protein